MAVGRTKERNATILTMIIIISSFSNQKAASRLSMVGYDVFKGSRSLGREVNCKGRGWEMPFRR